MRELRGTPAAPGLAMVLSSLLDSSATAHSLCVTGSVSAEGLILPSQGNEGQAGGGQEMVPLSRQARQLHHPEETAVSLVSVQRLRLWES